MIERIGTIKNPLTIIAIFAGIAEVSGTVVLPYIDASNQMYFIYFLIGFPILLVVLFFLTLNFNNRVLYAPSDFQDESNFLRISKYDQSKQEKVNINLKKSEFLDYINNLNERNLDIEGNLNKIQNILITHPELDKKYENVKSEDFLKSVYKITVNFFSDKSYSLVNSLKEKGYSAEIYEPPYDKFKIKIPSEHEAIWLGKNVPHDMSIEVIESAKKIFPFLKYIEILGDHGYPPENVHNEIFIGGATEAALRDNLKELKKSDFERLYKAASKSELHKFIRSFY